MIEVVPLDFMSVRGANADGYRPRPLPASFAPSTSGDARVSLARRLASSGLDRVDPAIEYALPTRPSPYDGSREVLAPGLADEGRAPLPSLSIDPAPLRAPASALEGPGLPSTGGADAPGGGIARPAAALRARESVLPRIEASPYTIGVGDVIAVQTDETSASDLGVDLGSLLEGENGNGGTSVGAPVSRPSGQQYLVQDNGEISLPGSGSIRVAGLTLREARRVISNRLVADRVGFDPSVEIAVFGSRKVAVQGLTGSQVLPVTVRPLTLREAVTATGGFGPDPSRTIVRVLRGGSIYEMSSARILGSSDVAGRILLDGDVVSVTPTEDLERSLAYFDQQVTLRALAREAFEDAIARRTDALAVAADRRAALAQQIEVETYAIAAETLRQQARIDALAARRETDIANETARRENILARQAYLDALQELEQENRAELREFEADSRAVIAANREERARERSERLDLLRLQLEDEQNRIADRLARAQLDRESYLERERLGAVEKDYVTVTGETLNQTIMALPFEGRLTLTRVLFEEANGIDRLTGDTSEIYVFRLPAPDAVDDRLRAYHLDASNPAALTVASLFEMRPDDVVYVNPQPIANWNRVITQILPSTGLLQSGVTGLRTLSN